MRISMRLLRFLRNLSTMEVIQCRGLYRFVIAEQEQLSIDQKFLQFYWIMNLTLIRFKIILTSHFHPFHLFIIAKSITSHDAEAILLSKEPASTVHDMGGPFE